MEKAMKLVKHLIESAISSFNKLQELCSSPPYSQVVRIQIAREKRKLSDLRDKLKLYLDPQILVVTVLVTNHYPPYEVPHSVTREETFYLANVPEEYVEPILKLRYANSEDIRILEIRKLGKN